MTTTELNELIITKLGVIPGTLYADFAVNAVRFHYHGNTYRVTTNLLVEKVDGACLVTDSDARQLEKLLRGEQWDGTGLPPVGTECEVRYRHGGADWGSFKCVATDQEIAFGWCGDEPVVLPEENYEFRPLRTERDKAIEQMLSTVTNYNNTSVIHAAGQIYDAIVAGKIDGLGKVG